MQFQIKTVDEDITLSFTILKTCILSVQCAC